DYYFRLPEGRKKEIDPAASAYYATDVFNDYAVEFIKQGQQADKPWFVFLGHSSPHFPVQAPADRADKYDAVYRRGWDVLRAERFDRMQKIGLIDGDQWQFSPRSIVPVDRDDIANGFAGQQNPAWDSLDENRQLDLARRMAIFAAMVEGVDQGVGKIVDHLRGTNDLENTLILFLSDNGACYEWGPFGFDGTSRRGTTTLRTGSDLRDVGGRGTHQSYGSAWANLGNTPFRLYKHFTHEGGISTPFIAHWPKGIGKPNKWVRQPAHVMDILPTLMDASGADYPRQLNGNRITPVEGQSLLPAFKGETPGDRTIGFDHQSAHAIRQGDWKAVFGKRMPDKPTWELYNLAEDRCEMNDLAKQQPERVAKMANDWEAWAKRVGVIWLPESQSAEETGGSSSIANRPLKISVTVVSENPNGVAIAQGGNQHGYALHFVDGKPAFDVRVKGRVKRLMIRQPASGEIKLTATLSAETMTLAVGDGEAISQESPGLIPVQPIDQLSVGFDARTAAGKYEAPNRLNGKVIRHSVKASDRQQKPPVKQKPTKQPSRHNDKDSFDGPKRPNFVFILTDDQGWTGLSTPMDKAQPGSQSDFYQTPNIARLAAAGMRFPRGYSPAPNCSPSRYANLTGKTCARLAFTDIVGRGHNTELKVSQKLRPGGKKTRQIRAEDVTIPELLKTLPGGYRTAHFGKWHLGGGGPEQHGFDDSDGPTGNREGSEGPTVKEDPKRAFSITSRANDFIEESVTAGRPFYCQVSHYAVHAKIQHRAETLAKTQGWTPGKSHFDPAYAAMVADLDAAVGQLLYQIEELGIADNTYIIYQADNGSPKFLSESPPLRRYKPEIWDGGIRVPTFLSGPGIASDSQCNEPVMGIDFLPTIWEWAGGDESALPANIDGGSLVSAVNAISNDADSQDKVERTGELVVHSPHYVLTKDGAKNQRPSSAIIDGRWKLVAWYETGDVHLFDLKTETSESTDVGDQHPEVKQNLRVRLRDYLSKVDALMPTLEPKHKSNSGAEGDVDNDGLPDRWEFKNLLTYKLGPDDDPDHDGQDNATELQMNSDPLVAQ
ncbi:MAG: sulfatase-like hydrolase/transferase, partial [Planctomycetota bacterium]